MGRGCDGDGTGMGWDGHGTGMGRGWDGDGMGMGRGWDVDLDGGGNGDVDGYGKTPLAQHITTYHLYCLFLCCFKIFILSNNNIS